MDLETDHHDRELRSFFEEVHRRPAPPFRRLWRAAREKGRRPSRPPIARFAAGGGLLATAAILAAVAWTILRTPAGEAPATAGPVAERSAIESVTDWQGPLDFLLRTPGRDLLETAPSFALELPTVSIETDFGNERRFEHDT